MEIHYVTAQADLEAYLSRNQCVVVQFTASWCGPCRAILPVVDELYRDPAYADIEFVRVDLDQLEEIPAAYAISSVPTLVFFSSGKEVARVSGANARDIAANLDRLAAIAPAANHGRHGSGAAPAVAALDKWSEVSHLVPTGYTILNESIDFARFEALNIVSRSSDTVDAVKDAFRTAADASPVATDADSQGLVYIPFLNQAKIYSVLVKGACVADTQRPSRIKIWSNQQACPLFDAAEDDAGCPHDQAIELDQAWTECRVKYVRFQKCTSITLFVDGPDADTPTAWAKVLLVGVSGAPSGPRTLPKP